MPYGINIASLIGSLFDEKMSPAKDIHLCMSLLLEGEKRHDRLCAMHALLVQANDKLCKNRNLPALMQVRDGIVSINRETGEYLWATAPRSKTIITVSGVTRPWPQLTLVTDRISSPQLNDGWLRRQLNMNRVE